MADLEDIEYAVNEVTQAVNGATEAVSRVEAAVKGIPSVIGWVFVGVVGAFVFDLTGSAWHSKWRYSLQYDVSSDKVMVNKKPHDCNFLAAPLGAKYCEYERDILVVRWATSTTGLPIISYDDGKTWNTFTPDTGVTVPKNSTAEEVEITWRKKEE